MEFLEKDLEQIIFNADRNKLKDNGLFIEGVLKRQLTIGNYGRADLIGFARKCNINGDGFVGITVYELKKDKIGISAFLQALGYLKGIEQYFKLREFPYRIVFNIVLIGRELDKNSTFCYLTDFVYPEGVSEFRFLKNYTYKYGIDGLLFEKQNEYSLINNGFKF